MSDFQLVEALDIYYASSGGVLIYTHHVIDFSAYAGTDQYIVIYLSGATNREMRMDNITYQSACISQSVTALAQDVTVQLNVFGTASVSTSMVDNGSTSDCGTPMLSLSQTDFDCSHVGVNQVTFTADDGWGNVDNQVINVTVVPSIDDETVSATQSSLCSGGSTTITTGSSVAGVNYYLRNDADNTVVDGPLVGNGSALTFNTGVLTGTTTFNVKGELAGNIPYGLSLNGSSSYASLGTSGRSITSQVTVSAWVRTTASGSNQFIVSKYNAVNGFLLYVNAAGKAAFDGRDGTGTYRASGASTTSVNDGSWHYITGTANTLTGVWSVYVDGQLENSGNNGTGSTLASSSDLRIGNYSTFYANAEVDMVNIWNTVLDQTQIEATMNECVDGSESGIVALFQCDEGAGTTIEDLSSTGTDGALVNLGANGWVTGVTDQCIDLDLPLCDREMSQLVTVTVGDVVAPVPNVASLSTINAQCEVTSLTAPTATDNCAGAITATPDVSLPLSASTTITWTYDDGNGNTSTQTQDVVINDNTAPVPNTPSLPTLTEYCELANVVDPSATDNCAGSLFGTATLNLPITTNTTITWTYDDGNGNTATQTQDVVILDIDVATTENGGTITANQSGATYQWVDCDNGNAPIQGETGQDFTPASSGNYAVEVTIGNCTETSACVNMMVTGVGEAPENELGVYPIPAKNELNVVCSKNIEGLMVHSVSGQHIRSYGQQTNRIDVSDLPNGMYLLVVQTENGPLQRRFIKE